MRFDTRQWNQLRSISISRHYTKYAEGSVLIQYGDTQVLCNVSVNEGLPSFLRGKEKEQGWLTAEYSMLPRATADRSNREASRGKQTGRTMEIQRLIARALRAVLDLKAFPGYTLFIDCDVIQADGGTRTASITGACVALVDAFSVMKARHWVKHEPLLGLVSAVSVGIVNGEPLLDLNYHEDSTAETDLNVVMTDLGGFVELQGTAEQQVFTESQLNAMLDLAKQGIEQLFAVQRDALNTPA